MGAEMRRVAIAWLGLIVASAAAAQPAWKVDFSELEALAEETVEVTLDGRMLALAAGFLSDTDPDERRVREIVEGLEGIYIYSFKFDREWAYDREIGDLVRSEMGSGWERLVTKRSKRGEDVDVWVRPAGDLLNGIFIVAAEPREFTVVNIIGAIDLGKLRDLEGQFGIPELDLDDDQRVGSRYDR